MEPGLVWVPKSPQAKRGKKNDMLRKLTAAAAAILLAAATLFIANCLVQDVYGINLIDYAKYSRDYTDEDKAFLKAHRKLVYGADKSSPPLRYVHPATGQYKGIVIDYLSGMSVELGTDIEFTPYVWAEALENLKTGKTDLCDMFTSEERANVYSFSLPIYKLRGAILSRRSEKAPQSLADLADKRIILAKGDYAEDFLRSKGVRCSFAYADSVEQGIELLLAGGGDAVVGDEPVLMHYMGTAKDSELLVMPDAYLYEQDVVLATKKGNDEFIGVLNKAILHLEKRGIIERLQQKWMGVTSPVEASSRQRQALAWTLGSFCVLAVMAVLFKTVHRRMRAEIANRTRELNHRKRELEKILENIPYMIFTLDRGRSVLDVTGGLSGQRAAGDLRGRGESEFSIAEFLADNGAVIEEVFTSGHSREMEMALHDAVLKAAFYPVLENGRTHNVIVTVKDVTLEKSAESKLLLENKMAAIGELATGMAHEIRNPLGLIRSYSFLIRNAQDQDPAALRGKIGGYLSIIDNSVERANTIIGNLLNFSRLSGDQVQSFSIRDLGAELFVLGEKACRTHAVKTVLDAPPELILHTNLESMKHILINLFSNAVDAMPHGGTLTLSCWREGRDALLEVADTGAGIAAQHLKSVFDPFFTTKDPGKGTGLGLYIVYNEVEKVGGEIRVQSKPGQGTVFTIRLRGAA